MAETMFEIKEQILVFPKERDTDVYHKELNLVSWYGKPEKYDMEDEHKRINHRLTDLEETVRQIGELTTSVHSLAQSVEQLVKSQNRQESRLEELENRDGDTWRKVKWYLLTLAIGAVFGLLVAQIGL